MTLHCSVSVHNLQLLSTRSLLLVVAPAPTIVTNKNNHNYFAFCAVQACLRYIYNHKYKYFAFCAMQACLRYIYI